MSADDHTTEAGVVGEYATRAAMPTPLNIGDRFHSVVVPDGGSVHVIDLEEKMQARALTPARKVGTFKVHDGDSFSKYVSKHGMPSTEVWADAVSSRIVGVLDAHDFGIPGWGQHRVEYTVLATDAWKAWIAFDGQLLDQATFAEHIENRSIDIVEPSAADMLELAQTFQATVGVDFTSAKVLSTGERQFEYRETVDAKAGKAGRLDIPDKFVLALIPFEGATPYKVTARLRYRIREGDLRIGYKLERPADIAREAFLDVVKSIEDTVEQPVFRGAHPA